MKSIVICASIVGLLTAAANAANITWQTPVTISGASDVNTQGTLHGSWAPGDDAYNPDSLPVNGVAFLAYGTSGVNFSAANDNLDHYTGYANPGTSDSNYNTILQAAIFSWSGNPITVSWDHLVVGHTYLVQAWLNDGRGGQSGTSTFTGGVSNSAPVAIGNGAPGQYIIGTFVADSSSQNFSMSPGIMLNLLQVRDISPGPNVTWGTPAAISGPLDVRTDGFYFGSWAPYNQDSFNNGSAGLVVNGTKFLASSDLPNLFTVGFNNGYNGYNNPNTSDGNYNDLLQTATYEGNGDGRPVSLSWTGMTPGHTYLVQIWANDGRGNSRTENFTGGANPSGTVTFGNAPGQYVVGTFVADAAGRQVISLSAAGSPNGPYPQVNLVQVRDITATPNVSWQTPAAISGPSDVKTNDNYFGSWAPYNSDSYNNGSAGLVVNGTKFLAASDLPNLTTFGFNNGYNGYNNPNTSDGNYNDLLQTATYEGNGDGRPVSLSWTGMTPGHTYQVQIWANDGRGNSRTESFTGGSNTSGTVTFGNAPGQYVVGTFKADSTGRQLISLSAAGSPNGLYPQVNLVQVRDLTTAANITWQAPATISGASDVSTQGIFVASWAPGDDYGSPNRSDDHPVNGVTFAAYGTGANFGFSGAGINMDRYNGFANPGTPDADYNYLLTVAAFNWNSGSSDMTVNWDSMILGHTYLVQTWLNDGRSGQSGTSTFTAGVNTSDPVAIGNGAPGQFVTGTFVANSSLQSFTMSPGIMLNLLQIRDLTPQPRITSFSVSGTTLSINATNGIHSGSFVLLGSTNVAAPLSQWTPVLTNSFNSSGNASFSTSINPPVPARFYRLSQ